MSTVISTGLLAYGMSGKLFQGPFIDAHQGFKLHAVTERHEKNAEKDFPGIISYDSTDELIADENIDLIVINTPNYLHYENAKKALEAGKHILVEKPFAATSEEATEIFELAEKLGKKVFVFQSRRWDSDFNAVKKIVDSGKLGKLSEVNFRYDRYKAGIGVKSFKEELFPATGLQYDLGPHLLDQVISLFGKPDSFHKILGKNRAGTKVDDYFSIHLSYPNSVNVFVHASMLVVDVQPSFVLHGEKGSFIKERADIQEEQLLKGIKPNDAGFGVEARGKEGKLTLIDTNGERTQELVPSDSATYLSLFEEVYQSLVNDKAFPVTREQILAQLEILQAQ
ncbi:Predicted dehydrogenase [Pedobacter westerhofensis]|uniref:Predicted dehydrogenase n=1 Tax=Pedobacter westerhofensis TaxID=425512 RepID=A0A521EHQ2_9SPHI|nr:Gfo/Idh/MocA family oxidoreductase [Pedobacter westerhofensis]SMO83443.1 Predicted dehydrogenase [Pedobacter westerhofensis]